jgi:hypothetical protein
MWMQQPTRASRSLNKGMHKCFCGTVSNSMQLSSPLAKGLVSTWPAMSFRKLLSFRTDDSRVKPIPQNAKLCGKNKSPFPRKFLLIPQVPLTTGNTTGSSSSAQWHELQLLAAAELRSLQMPSNGTCHYGPKTGVHCCSPYLLGYFSDIKTASGPKQLDSGCRTRPCRTMVR